MTALNMTMVMVALLIGCSSAFQMISSPTIQRSSSLNMAAKGGGPRFDKATEKWIVTDPTVSR